MQTSSLNLPTKILLQLYLTIQKESSVLSNSSLSQLIGNNDAEEADQKIVRHMLDCVNNGYECIMIRTIDTDVIVSLISFRLVAGHISTKVYACLTSLQTKFFDINKLSQELGEIRSKALTFFLLLVVVMSYLHSSTKASARCMIDGWSHRRN